MSNQGKLFINLTKAKHNFNKDDNSNKKTAASKYSQRPGAGGGGRTRTLLPGPDFESGTSANCITPAGAYNYTKANG